MAGPNPSPPLWVGQVDERAVAIPRPTRASDPDGPRTRGRRGPGEVRGFPASSRPRRRSVARRTAAMFEARVRGLRGWRLRTPAGNATHPALPHVRAWRSSAEMCAPKRVGPTRSKSHEVFGLRVLRDVIARGLPVAPGNDRLRLRSMSTKLEQASGRYGGKRPPPPTARSWYRLRGHGAHATMWLCGSSRPWHRVSSRRATARLDRW